MISVQIETGDTTTDPQDINAETISVQIETGDTSTDPQDINAETIRVQIETGETTWDQEDINADTVSLHEETVHTNTHTDDIDVETVSAHIKTIHTNTITEDKNADTITVVEETVNIDTKNMHPRNHRSVLDKHGMHIIKMCIAVSIAFLVSTLVCVVLAILQYWSQDEYTSGHLQKVMVVLVMLNHSINFILYTLVSADFRGTLVQIFRGRVSSP